MGRIIRNPKMESHPSHLRTKNIAITPIAVRINRFTIMAPASFIFYSPNVATERTGEPSAGYRSAQSDGSALCFVILIIQM